MNKENGVDRIFLWSTFFFPPFACVSWSVLNCHWSGATMRSIWRAIEDETPNGKGQTKTEKDRKKTESYRGRDGETERLMDWWMLIDYASFAPERKWDGTVNRLRVGEKGRRTERDGNGWSSLVDHAYMSRHYDVIMMLLLCRYYRRTGDGDWLMVDHHWLIMLIGKKSQMHQYKECHYRVIMMSLLCRYYKHRRMEG